ncbi:MAG: sulfur oxidation c-type cytochrome SoxA [Gammaproteobacteria bacterium]|nr:sulfur oxidation c-type cytochrome SoxA [Gammaproteobacteria bacterium]
MQKMMAVAVALVGILGSVNIASASPESDKKAFQNYYKNKFPQTKFSDFANGVYSIDAASREQWETIEEFPPYELDISEGEEIYNKSAELKSCFPDAPSGVAHKYPYFDTSKGEVITLPLAINNCLQAAGKEPMKYEKGKIAQLTAYMAYQSRGKKVDVKVPNEAAQAAYEDGKKFYYTRRGQLNMACAHCHIDNAGMRIRADLLSPGLGHPTHFPVYRSKWGGLGTLHRRFGGCNKQVRAKPFKAQSKEYRNLEYFLTYMSNGLEWNGPGSRK